MKALLAGTSCLVLAGCGGDDPATPAPDAATPPPAWSKTLPPAREAIGVRRGLTPARGIVHLHSVYSHDACDGRPRDERTGAVDEACLGDLRAALCATRIDFAALTDHDGTMADEEFADLFLVRGDGDELVRPPGGGDPFAAQLECDDGHRVIVFVGGENDLMPIMLDRHPDGTMAERHAYYNAKDAAAVAAFRAHGGLVWIPHTEQRSEALLRELAPDGIEIYNLHANLDPDIRRDYLGLSPSGAVNAVIEYAADQTAVGREPDLALAAFLEPSAVAVERWDALLGAGMRVTGTAGSDAHQNAFPIPLADGERGDSYRRVLRWFSNVALVDDADDPARIEAAIAAGRVFSVFEMFGTPAGFDVVARGGAQVAELGDEVAAGAGAELEVTVPTVYELDPALPVPTIRARVLRADATGTTEVAAGAGPTVTAVLDAPGAYRVEVLIAPEHIRPYIGDYDGIDPAREQVWIYASPIYVRGDD
jgi:hypothetical protein